MVLLWLLKKTASDLLVCHLRDGLCARLCVLWGRSAKQSSWVLTVVLELLLECIGTTLEFPHSTSGEKLIFDFKTPDVLLISLFIREMKLGCELPQVASWGHAVEPIEEKQGNRSSKGRARRLLFSYWWSARLANHGVSNCACYIGLQVDRAWFQTKVKT